MEVVRSVQPIKIFGKENNRYALWKNKYIEYLNANSVVAKLNNLFANTQKLLQGIELLLSEINSAISKLKITRIVIAHRQETIAMAERIVNLQEINS